MNSIVNTEQDAVDQALVACLLSFARRGREVRLQQQTALCQASDKEVSIITHQTLEQENSIGVKSNL